MNSTSKPSTAMRETDTLLWRGSRELGSWVKESANEEDVSQNAVMTAALLVASMLGRISKLGHPRNVLILLNAIESALETKSSVWGHFHIEDWEEIQGWMEAFLKVRLISEPQTKSDERVVNAIAYSFSITKAGEETFPSVIDMLRSVYEEILRCDKKA